MAKNWTKLYKKYKGMWVALDGDEETVLGFGVTVKEAVEQAKRKTTRMPFLTHVPKTLDAYVGERADWSIVERYVKNQGKHTAQTPRYDKLFLMKCVMSPGHTLQPLSQ